jgi:hypothetical protein
MRRGRKCKFVESLLDASSSDMLRPVCFGNQTGDFLKKWTHWRQLSILLFCLLFSLLSHINLYVHRSQIARQYVGFIT